MEKLPDAVLATILSYLNVFDCFEPLCMVCKRFKACVHNPLAWAAVDLSSIQAPKPMFWSYAYCDLPRTSDFIAKALQRVCSITSPQTTTDLLRCVVDVWPFPDPESDRFSDADSEPQDISEPQESFFHALGSFVSLTHVHLKIPAIHGRIGDQFAATIAGMIHLRSLSLDILGALRFDGGDSAGFPSLPLHVLPHLEHMRLCINDGPYETSQPGTSLTVPSSLITLNLTIFSQGALEQVDFSNATKLESLDISVPQGMTNFIGLRQLSKLNRLSLISSSLSDCEDVDGLGGLREVHITQCIFPQAILQRLSRVPNSQVSLIRLKCCTLSPDAMVSLSKLRHLTTLEFDGLRKATPSQTYTLLSNIHSLTSLKVHDGKHHCINRDFFKGVRLAPALTHLDLKFEQKVYDCLDKFTDLHYLLGRCTNLRSLKFSPRYIVQDSYTDYGVDYNVSMLNASDAETIGLLDRLVHLSIPVPTSQRAFLHLHKLKQLQELELRFDSDWTDKISGAWFRCLHKLVHLRTLVLSFQHGSPLLYFNKHLLLQMATSLSVCRQLSHIDLDVQPYQPRDVFQPLAGAFARFHGIKLTVCGQLYDLGDNCVRQRLEVWRDELLAEYEAAQQKAFLARASKKRKRSEENED